MKAEKRGDPHYVLCSLEAHVHLSSSSTDGEVIIQHPPGACFYLKRDFEIRSITAGGGLLPFHRLPEEHLHKCPPRVGPRKAQNT